MDLLFVLLAVLLGIGIFAIILTFQMLRLLACALMTPVLLTLLGA
ncbi:hypothetical protein [Xiamenia xianingshaonis]|nr:hypothetical protein [Xiamenia xianingshaonis]